MPSRCFAQAASTSSKFKSRKPVRERRYSGIEVRAEGRRLVGPAVSYGEISPSHRERFEAGAFSLDTSEVRYLDYQHDRSRVLAFTGAGLSFRDTDSALIVEATLPALPLADVALDEVRSGKLTGFSIEFKAIDERTEEGIRIVSRAELPGVGLVSRPSYQGSRVELRARSGRTLRATIPSGRKLSCRCSGQDCGYASFAGDVLAEAIEEGFSKGVQEAGDDVLAAWGSYDAPLASRSAGTMRASMVDGNAVVDIDLPIGPEGDAVLRAAENSGIVVRPHLDSALSESTITTADRINALSNLSQRQEVDAVRVYSKMRIRGIVVNATDAREGWPSPEFIATPEVYDDTNLRRRAAIWL